MTVMERLRFHARENWYRDVWLLLITVVLLFAVKAISDTVQEVQEGRRTGTTITCVVTSSILRGSHAFIISSGSAPLPGKIEARLLREGYPRKRAREVAAARSADAYTKAVGDAIVDAVGKQARGLVAAGKAGEPAAGTVNCEQLKVLTRTR